jgi:hypothetical protein
VADWGWSAVGVSLPVRQKLKRLVDAGPIERHEYEHAREKASKKSHPVAFFLGVVEGQRKDAEEEAKRGPAPGPTASHGRGSSPVTNREVLERFKDRKQREAEEGAFTGGDGDAVTRIQGIAASIAGGKAIES